MDPAVDVALCPNCHRHGFKGGMCQACGYKPFEPSTDVPLPAADGEQSLRICPRCRKETATSLSSLMANPEWIATEGKRQAALDVRLNDLFAPPNPPAEVSMSLIVPIAAASGAGLATWLIFEMASSAAAPGSRAQTVLQAIGFLAALGAVVGSFLGIWQQRARGSASAYADDMTRFKHAYRVWEKLFYCPECNCVADLDRGLSVDAKDIKRLKG